MLAAAASTGATFATASITHWTAAWVTLAVCATSLAAATATRHLVAQETADLRATLQPPPTEHAVPPLSGFWRYGGGDLEPPATPKHQLNNRLREDRETEETPVATKWTAPRHIPALDSVPASPAAVAALYRARAEQAKEAGDLEAAARMTRRAQDAETPPQKD